MLDTANGETAGIGLYRNEGPLAVATWLREVVYPALDATDVAGDLGAYVAQLLALPVLKPLLTRLPQFRSALLYTHELCVLRYEPHNRPRSHSRWYCHCPITPGTTTVVAGRFCCPASLHQQWTKSTRLLQTAASHRASRHASCRVLSPPSSHRASRGRR